MSSLALTSGWYHICTSYCTPDTKEYYIGQRTTVCSRIDKIVEQNVEDRDKIVDNVLLTDKQTDGMNELKVGTAFEILYKVQTERLARVVSNSRVYGK